MFAFSYDYVGESPERYAYHALEMLQSVAENRACGESGIAAVRAYEGHAATDRVFSLQWGRIYRALCGFLNLADTESFSLRLTKPLFFEIDYADGLRAGILHAALSARPDSRR